MERTQVGGHKMATVVEGALVVDKMEVQVDKVVAIMDKVRNKVQAQENKEGAQ